MKTIDKSGVVLGARGAYGQVDTVLYNTSVRGERFSDNQLGLEAGYSLAYKFADRWSVNGRAAYGRSFNRGLGAPETTGDYQTAAIGVGYALMDHVGIGVGYRRRFGDLGLQNQYLAGGTYAFDKHWSLRANYVHNVYPERQTNGFNTLLLYVF